MNGDAEHAAAGSPGATIEFLRKQQVRQLGVVVRATRRVIALALEIIEVDLAVAVRQRGHGDYPGCSRLLQGRHEQACQSEMTEVIRAELPLETIDRELARRQRHDAGVV